MVCSLLFLINSKLIARRHKIMNQRRCKIAMLLFHSGCALLINGTNHCNYISLETILKYNLKQRQKRQRKKLLPYNSNISDGIFTGKSHQNIKDAFNVQLLPHSYKRCQIFSSLVTSQAHPDLNIGEALCTNIFFYSLHSRLYAWNGLDYF